MILMMNSSMVVTAKFTCIIVEYGAVKKDSKTGQEHSSSDNTDTEVDGPLSQSSSSSSGSKSKWETVIVVAVNLSRLDVNTNMGSVMGQTS